MLDERTRKVSGQMADRWIRFANGQGWCGEGKVIVVGDEGIVEVNEDVYDKKYRAGRGKVLESIGAERLWKVVEGWQGVRSDEFEGLGKSLL
jgi:hypothetical protein